jgi:hypothetical protein
VFSSLFARFGAYIQAINIDQHQPMILKYSRRQDKSNGIRLIRLTQRNPGLIRADPAENRVFVTFFARFGAHIKMINTDQR